MYCDSFATSRYYVTFGVLCSLCVRATAVATGQIKIIVIITHFQWHFLVLGIQCVLFLYVRFLKRKLQSKIRLSGGVQEHVRLMQTLATYQSWDRGRGSDNTVIRTQRAQCVSTLKQISVLAKQQKNSVKSLGKLWYCTNENQSCFKSFCWLYAFAV